MVSKGRIYLGRTGAAMEGGHLSINFRGSLCGCGKKGCIEAYASGSAIARRARELLNASRNRRSQFSAMEGAAGGISAELVTKAAGDGDATAIQILEKASDHLAIWLGGIIDLLEPDVIVIAAESDTFPRWQEIPIVEAHYGPESALVGAAALSFKRK